MSRLADVPSQLECCCRSLSSWRRITEVPDVSSYVHLATGMLRSVAFLHSRQLVHRDIKASALLTVMKQSLPSIIMQSLLSIIKQSLQLCCATQPQNFCLDSDPLGSVKIIDMGEYPQPCLCGPYH